MGQWPDRGHTASRWQEDSGDTNPVGLWESNAHRAWQTQDPAQSLT